LLIVENQKIRERKKGRRKKERKKERKGEERRKRRKEKELVAGVANGHVGLWT
jgi:hypothetical protein